MFNLRQSTTFADLVLVSVEEAAKLLISAANKHCLLDPHTNLDTEEVC